MISRVRAIARSVRLTSENARADQGCAHSPKARSATHNPGEIPDASSTLSNFPLIRLAFEDLAVFTGGDPPLETVCEAEYVWSWTNIALPIPRFFLRPGFLPGLLERSAFWVARY
jgi:hypothetical protein